MLVSHFLNEVSQRVWWHGSFNGRIKKWRPFGHFGTWKAAVQRFLGRGETTEYLDLKISKDKKCYFYPVHLDFNKNNSLIYNDDLFTENSQNDLVSVLRAKRTPFLEKKYPKTYKFLDNLKIKWYMDSMDFLPFFPILKEEKLDVIIYRNRFEDPMSKSAFVINPEIISYAGEPIIRSLDRLYDTRFLNARFSYKQQKWSKPDPTKDISGI